MKTGAAFCCLVGSPGSVLARAQLRQVLGSGRSFRHRHRRQARIAFKACTSFKAGIALDLSVGLRLAFLLVGGSGDRVGAVRPAGWDPTPLARTQLPGTPPETKKRGSSGQFLWLGGVGRLWSRESFRPVVRLPDFSWTKGEVMRDCVQNGRGFVQKGGLCGA